MNGELRDDADAWRERNLLPRIFHLISQPITALQCSLEFALNTVEDPRQCRSWVEAALENSERLRCRLSLAREVAEAADPGDNGVVELASVLQEALCEVAPLFQGAGSTPGLQCEGILVAGERSRLLRAFLYLLQHLSASNTLPLYQPEIEVKREAELIELRFLRFVLQENSSKDYVTSQLEIARGTFESAGGGLIFYCFPGNDAFVRVFLRAPQAQLNLYEDATRMKPASAAIGKAAAFPQVS